MPKKGNYQMVQEALEQAAIRPVEKDQEDFEFWCGNFGVRPVTRVDFYVRRIDALPRTIEHTEAFLRAIKDIDTRRRQQVKSTPREQALLASELKAAVWRLHDIMQKEIGRD